MATAPRVFTIPASTPFVPTLIRALVDGTLVPGFPAARDPLALADATLYLPTRRACRLARDLFLDVTRESAAILPRIVAIGDVYEWNARGDRRRREGAPRRRGVAGHSGLQARGLHDALPVYQPLESADGDRPPCLHHPGVDAVRADAYPRARRRNAGAGLSRRARSARARGRHALSADAARLPAGARSLPRRHPGERRDPAAHRRYRRRLRVERPRRSPPPRRRSSPSRRCGPFRPPGARPPRRSPGLSAFRIGGWRPPPVSSPSRRRRRSCRRLSARSSTERWCRAFPPRAIRSRSRTPRSICRRGAPAGWRAISSSTSPGRAPRSCRASSLSATSTSGTPEAIAAAEKALLAVAALRAIPASRRAASTTLSRSISL